MLAAVSGPLFSWRSPSMPSSLCTRFAGQGGEGARCAPRLWERDGEIPDLLIRGPHVHRRKGRPELHEASATIRKSVVGAFVAAVPRLIDLFEVIIRVRVHPEVPF